ITPDERDALLAEFPEVAVAGVHNSRHVTFSGDTWVIDALEKSCQQRAFLYQRIAVDYAFHSPAIRPLKAASLASIKKYTTGAFTLPFYSCATVARCRVIDAEHFWGIVESPINFADTIDLIEASATGATPVYVDLSPSGSLHGFVKQHLGAFRAKQVPVSLTLMSLMSNDTTQYQAGVLTLKRLAKAYSESAIAQPGPQDTTLVNHSMEKTRTSVVGNNPAKNTALVFPGQASQRVGMGRELFQRFRRQTEIASDILGYSIEQLCLEDPQKQLNKTQYTQPALYTVCALQYLAYREDNEVVIKFLAGHSLGEYAALFAADVFDFETGLRIVKHRGELMSSANAGSMAVILNYKAQDLQQLLNDNGITSIDVANINSPDQLVIAGPHQALEAFEGIINSLAGTYIPIP
ncbi:acyltransferase domain-containing protein, partial [Pseudomonas syringae]|uniref:acyltransferase domain-containing protein n=1 Tax=Pseudomonas syringae TaxID=317 RepID=UPI001F396057